METQSIAIPLNSAVSIAHHKSLVPKESLKKTKYTTEEQEKARYQRWAYQKTDRLYNKEQMWYSRIPKATLNYAFWSEHDR